MAEIKLPRGRRLRLVGVSDLVRQALQVTHVENFLRFYATSEEAEQAA